MTAELVTAAGAASVTVVTEPRLLLPVELDVGFGLGPDGLPGPAVGDAVGESDGGADEDAGCGVAADEPDDDADGCVAADEPDGDTGGWAADGLCDTVQAAAEQASTANTAATRRRPGTPL